jgi:hypothetical protein
MERREKGGSRGLGRLVEKQAHVLLGFAVEVHVQQ